MVVMVMLVMVVVVNGERENRVHKLTHKLATVGGDSGGGCYF